MFSEYLNLNLMSRRSPVDIWRALELKVPIKIVSGRYVVDSLIKNVLSRSSPVDAWRVLELKTIVKSVSCRCLKSFGVQNYCQDRFLWMFEKHWG